MLRFEQVYKVYRHGSRRIEALRGVNLLLEEPGFFAIMGPSGSGKSTLLHLAAGLDRPDTGRIDVNGTDLSGMSERKLTVYRRRNIGIVFQQYNLIPTLTAAQNIALPGVLDRQPKRWTRDRTAKLMDDLNLAHRAEHRPDALSGGEQQRVAIARALFFDPPLLLADEPTGSLDSASSEKLWALLEDLAHKRRITVVMVTHEPAAAVRCRRVFVLADGQCRGQFEINGLDPAGVASRYQQFGG